MPASKPTAWIIAGPTAVGKTGIAIQVAERVGGEIIGADAFQIYRGLEILTAKPTPAERARVPHHLIGSVDPAQSFDVAQYLAAARACIAEVAGRGKVPIIVGGTGLYLRALTRGLAELPPADAALRDELSALSLKALQAELRERDPTCAAQIDLQNPRRLIRALEVCRLTGQPFSSFRREWAGEGSSDFTGVVLVRERAALYRRIDERMETMFADGVIDEVAALPPLGPTAGQVLGLREIRAHLAGELTREQCTAAIQQATRRYAKRQLTWFAREPFLAQVDASASDVVDRVIAAINRDR
jgi:tRNA dimethylallyltransferase